MSLNFYSLHNRTKKMFGSYLKVSLCELHVFSVAESVSEVHKTPSDRSMNEPNWTHTINHLLNKNFTRHWMTVRRNKLLDLTKSDMRQSTNYQVLQRQSCWGFLTNVSSTHISQRIEKRLWSNSYQNPEAKDIDPSLLLRTWVNLWKG